MSCSRQQTTERGKKSLVTKTIKNYKTHRWTSSCIVTLISSIYYFSHDHSARFLCLILFPFFSHRKQGYLFRQPTQVTAETGFMNGNLESSRPVQQSS